jgi:transketolase
LVSGGQGERIAARLAELGCRLPVRLLGLREVPACGRNDEVLRFHGLDAQGIQDAAQALVATSGGRA